MRTGPMVRRPLIQHNRFDSTTLKISVESRLSTLLGEDDLKEESARRLGKSIFNAAVAFIEKLDCDQKMRVILK